jgi:hypothetical protein
MRSDLLRLQAAPGGPKSGTKWQYLGHFSLNTTRDGATDEPFGLES